MKQLFIHIIETQANSFNEIKKNIDEINTKSSYFKFGVTETGSEMVRINEFPIIGFNALAFIAKFKISDFEEGVIKVQTGIRSIVFYVLICLFFFNVILLITSKSFNYGKFPLIVCCALLFFSIYRYYSFIEKIKEVFR